MSGTESDADRLARRAAAALRNGAEHDATGMERLIARARTEPIVAPRSGAGAFRWKMGSALLGTLAAGILIGLSWPRFHDNTSTEALPAPSTALSAKQPVQFVFVAPAARRVSLVGEFNGWNSKSTPMSLARNGKVWAVSLDLAPGRHVYAFLVDDSTWVADPQAPIAPETWYGDRKSVVVVANRSKF